MTPLETCPDDDSLARFAEGALDAATAEALGRHSETCADCRRVLGALARLRSSRSGDGDHSALPSALLTGLAEGTQFGRYVLQRPLGAGAMGVVYEATDPALARRVAVKLMKGPATDDARARLTREAQTMAKLSHRNVATVFDVGAWEDRTWVAMEFIDGATLRQWLQARARTPGEILNALLDAGRGLAAAHAQGVVHRDFKPDNVLVEHSGRVVVTDFGLSTSGESPGHALLATGPLARTRGLVGTPAYMAPELFAKQAADARSDQFAFCVAAVEAFAGRRPWDASSIDALAEQHRSGRVDELALAKVPARLRKPIVRGLSARPEERFPSMEALLAQLAPPSRSRVALAVGLLSVALIGSVGAWTWHRAQLCSGASQKLSGVWDAAARDALHAAFLATKLPFAEAASVNASRQLDTWAAEWTRGWTDACEAGQVRRTQSTALMDLRMACLGERLSEVRVLTQLLAHADAELVQTSTVTAGLGALSLCADERALRAPIAPPTGAAAAEVAAAREQLAAVVAQRSAGRFTIAREALSPLVERITALRYRPLEAEALVLRAELEESTDAFEPAASSLYLALVAAEAGGHAAMAARAWALLVRVLGEHQAKYAEAHHAAELAAAMAEHQGKPADLEVLLARNLAELLSDEGKHDLARVQLEHALSLQEHGDPDSPQVAATLNALGNTVRRLGDVPGSLALHQRALALLERTLGPAHPDVALVLKNIGNVYWSQSKLEPALEWYQKALAVQQAALGPDALQVASTRNNVASVFIRQGKLVEAEAALRESLRIEELKLGLTHPTLFGVLNNLAVVRRYQGDAPGAVVLLTRALDVAEKAHGPEHEDVATTLINLGDAQLASHDFAASVASYERAAVITEKTSGSAHSDLADCLGGLAFPLLELKQYRRAFDATQRALAIYAKAPGVPLVEGQVHFAHARAQFELDPASRRLAVAEARTARETLSKSGAQDSDLVEVDAWLKAH